jgi:hypothetical protein
MPVAATDGAVTAPAGVGVGMGTGAPESALRASYRPSGGPLRGRKASRPRRPGSGVGTGPWAPESVLWCGASFWLAVIGWPSYRDTAGAMSRSDRPCAVIHGAQPIDPV